MPIRKKSGETKEEFVSRCIPIEMANGKPQDQAIAICYAYYDEKQLNAFKSLRRKSKVEKFESSLINKMKGLGTKIETLGLKKEDFNEEYQFDLEFRGLNVDDLANDEDLIAYYQYVGPTPQRTFCQSVMAEVGPDSGKVFSFEDVVSLNSDNPGFGEGGKNTYSVFKYRGGVNCKHIWVKYFYNKTKGTLVKARVQPSQDEVGYVNK
jgi:hypothetical protein